MVSVFCGIDWARTITTSRWSTTTARCWPSDGSATTPRVRRALQLLAEAGDSAETPIPVAIETSPRPAGRLPARHRPPGLRDQPDGRVPLPRPALGRRKKSDAGTRWCWPTSCAPTRRAPQRCPPTPSLPRPSRCSPAPSRTRSGHRTDAHNKLRSLLREYYPALPGRVRAPSAAAVCAPSARALLAAAPTPAQAARLTLSQLRALLHRAGPQAQHRRRGRAAPDSCCAPTTCTTRRWSRRPSGVRPWPLLRQLDAACVNAEDLAEAAAEPFEQHPDASHHHQLARARSTHRRPGPRRDRRRPHPASPTRKASRPTPAAAPVTRASGKSDRRVHRRVKNQRLAAVGYVWAFAALTASPGARAHYDRRRAAGDRHAAAQRNLFNRIIGCLHHCLNQRVHYSETAAFPATSDAQLGKAA